MMICVDLGGTHLRTALVDEKGDITNFTKISSRMPTSQLLELIITQIQQLISDYRSMNTDSLSSPSPISSIGISTGGIVENGQICSATDLITGWSGVNLADHIESIFQIPVLVGNDGNCSALAEREFGAAKNCNNFMVLTLGTGVGIGMCVNGCIIPFSEIHHKVEKYFSGKRFEEGALLQDNVSHLAHYISLIIELLTPEKIILSGPIGRDLEFISIFQEELEKETLPFHFKRCQILVSQLEHQGLLGASRLINM